MPKPKKPSLKEAHKRLLTPLVLRKSRRLVGIANVENFRVWRKSRRVEFLPDGTPFKVSNGYLVRLCAGTFVDGLNKPLILVSDLLSKKERQMAAQHEQIEWLRKPSPNYPSTRAKGDKYAKAKEYAHRIAKKRENPGLKDGAEKSSEWAVEMLGKLGIAGMEKLTRADYLKWLEARKRGK